MHATQRESYLTWLRRRVGSGLIISPAVAAVIRDAAGRLLLQEKSSGEGWSLPAGGVELGESPHEAIVREVMEEAGLEVRVGRILGVFGGTSFRHTYPNGDEVEYVVTLFECEVVGGTGLPTDNETSSVAYFARDAMPALALPYPMTALFDA